MNDELAEVLDTYPNYIKLFQAVVRRAWKDRDKPLDPNYYCPYLFLEHMKQVDSFTVPTSKNTWATYHGNR